MYTIGMFVSDLKVAQKFMCQPKYASDIKCDTTMRLHFDGQWLHIWTTNGHTLFMRRRREILNADSGSTPWEHPVFVEYDTVARMVAVLSTGNKKHTVYIKLSGESLGVGDKQFPVHWRDSETFRYGEIECNSTCGSWDMLHDQLAEPQFFDSTIPADGGMPISGDKDMTKTLCAALAACTETLGKPEYEVEDAVTIRKAWYTFMSDRRVSYWLISGGGDMTNAETRVVYMSLSRDPDNQ